jgi:branched-chain amino acid aminotransferase
LELPILTYFIKDNNIQSTCDFIPSHYEKGTIYYEVLRVIDSIPLFLEDHVKRLFKSIELSGKQSDISAKSVVKRILALIKYNDLKVGNIRFQIIENEDKYDFIAMIVPSFYPSADLYNYGVETITFNKTRSNPNQKILNPALRKKAEVAKKENNVFELILTENNMIMEGSKSNIFFVNESGIFTPETNQVLPGITRHYVIKAAQKLSINIFEKKIMLDELKDYSSAFLSGTSLKILPVSRLNNHKLEVQNKATDKLQKEYDRMISDYVRSFSLREHN